MVSKFKELVDLGEVKKKEDIENEKKILESKKVDKLASKKKLESEIKEWEKKYTDIEGLLNKLVEAKMNLKKNNDELDKLASLPEGYKTSDEFRKALTDLRKNYEGCKDKINIFAEQYFEAEKNFPNSTYEELVYDYKEQENNFNRLLEKVNKLLKIKDEFERLQGKMDEISFNPLINSFSNYITILTNGAYKSGNISNNFSLEIIKDKRKGLSIDLLSAGTYDVVALALRLAILEYIFKDTDGFLILDDCLVDLDSTRKEKSIKLIKEFSKEYQVIFTTCSKETANALGGNIIEISKISEPAFKLYNKKMDRSYY